MAFFISMFFCNIIIPLVILIAGIMMYKNPPKEINNTFGYRTSFSKKNQDTWNFAHECCGKLWIKLGIISLILSAVIQLPHVHGSEKTIGIVSFVVMGLQLVLIFASIAFVEKQLRKNFDENGNRKLK